MSAKHISTLGAIGVVTALIITGCSPSGESDDPESTEIAIGFEYDTACLDPHGTITNEGDIIRQFVDNLTDQDPETGEIVPWLAEDIEVNEDSTQFVFTLREGITFANGEALDADAVVLNYEEIKEKLPSNVVGLETVTAVDARTVQFDFSRPNAGFLQATSTVKLGLLAPETITEATDEERCLGEKLYGTGPYTVDEFLSQQEVSLTARDDYAWASPLSSNEGAATVGRVVFKLLPLASVRTGSLISGDIDIDHLVDPEQQELLDAQGFAYVESPRRGVVNTLFPNTDNSLLSDPELRKIVASLIDRKALEEPLAPNNRPAESLLTTATTYFTDHSDILQDTVADPEAALDALGWTIGDDGVRYRDGQPLELRVITRNHDARKITLEVVKEQLRPYGITLLIEVQDNAIATENEDSGNYEFAYWNLTRNDPDTLNSLFSQTDGRNPSKRGENAELDALLAAQAQASDSDQRQQIVDELVTYLIENVYAIPMFEETTKMAISDRIENLVLDAESRPRLQELSVER